jgi:hypothetical protein
LGDMKLPSACGKLNVVVRRRCKFREVLGRSALSSV